MKLASIGDTLWGSKARFQYLLIAAIVLLFAFLGARDIWTQEHRWADIVAGMFYRHDFLHPYLGNNDYYDKPLLSYWLIVIAAKITGIFNTWILRLPSALSGLLAIWSIYRLGTKLRNPSLGLLSGWLLLTTFYFLFWARTSSADMLNLAGSLFAVAWYMEKRESATFFDFFIFFLIIGLTSLCKGLVGAIVPAIVVTTDVVLRKSFRQYLRWSVILALIPALIIYMLPFFASSYFSTDNYGQNGLYLVYRENIVRYFQPFDHQGPIYTYFVYLPIYLLPWAIFFIPALISLKSRFRNMNLNSKWIVWSLLALFMFFTLSGSRRSYYVLPMVPFAILLTADWILDAQSHAKRQVLATASVLIASLLLFLAVDVIPAWYYHNIGIGRFAAVLKEESGKQKPWSDWHIVMLDAESKLNFYLQLPPTALNYQIKGSTRTEQTTQSLVKSWPVLTEKPLNTIFITRKLYWPLIKDYFVGYRIVELSSKSHLPFIKKHDTNVPIALIPIS